MAVDRLADHVGTHGGAYTDNDGQRKQFTYIDHDVKTKIFTGNPQKAGSLTDYREDLITRILKISPSFCSMMFIDFTLRGDVDTIKWNETMIRDQGIELDRLRDLYTLAKNKETLNTKGLI